MIAALVEVELHVPAATSLKEKRGVVKRVVARLRNDLHVSVAEIGYQDLWQRALLGVAIAAGSETGARKVAQQVEAVLVREHRVEPIRFVVDIVASEH